MNLYDLPEVVFRHIKSRVVKECERLGIDGVFVMALSDPEMLRWAYIRRDDGLDNASDGRKYNLLAIAFAKVAYVLMHDAPSGQVLYEGEVPYRGGIHSEFGDPVFAFSGGTEDQDVEIVRIAAQVYLEYDCG